jgi:response regulator NasT
VGQIVPSVEAAFARLRSAEPPLATAAAAAPTAVPLPTLPGTWADPVPLAVGVLMHRHSLSRGDAWRRLQRLADEHKIAPAAQAERLLGAVEELARSA